MHISIKWFGDQFNINLAAKEGADDFLSVKACRIVEGSDGPFIGFPSVKKKDGDWFRFVWANDKFQAAVIEKAKASMPAEQAKPKETAPTDDFDDDIPF